MTRLASIQPNQMNTVQRAAHARAVAAPGEQGVVELVAAIGYDTLVSLTAVAFDILWQPD